MPNSDQGTTKNIGLRGIPVADTKICLVDGLAGRLFYRGFLIQTLAEKSSFEETAYLLLYGQLPTRAELEAFSHALITHRTLPQTILDTMRDLPKTSGTMDVLQGVMADLATTDPLLRQETLEANVQKAVRIVSMSATAVAAWHRIRSGKEVVPPREDLSHAANFLFMLHGKEPHIQTAKDFDICLIFHAEHSFNASTFTARVIASTRAHMYAAISGAVGALSGEWHGGANSEVMRTLEAIGSVEKVPKWVKDQLDGHQKVMGMGHPVYKAYDPRARMLKAMAEGLAKRTSNGKWYEMTKALEETAKREFEARGHPELYPNVDLYSASVYGMMDIPVDLFTPVFAVARTSGWSAHVIEEKFAQAQAKPVIYRPECTYIGRWSGTDGCEYEPIAQRGTSVPVKS